MSEFLYQRSKADGSLNYTDGTGNLDKFMERVQDEMRFHRGKGFQVEKHDKTRLTLALDEVLAFLKHHDPGDPVLIRSNADGFGLKLRKIKNPNRRRGDLVVKNARSHTGTPYVFGVTDCSWLSEASYKPIIGDDWVHNAHYQHLMFGSRPGYLSIQRSQIQIGDLLFIDSDHHVAVYAGKLPEYDNIECVVDTEPHDTRAPAGWPTTSLQTGVRIRPMIGNYYCSWQFVNGIGRVVEVNGQP